MIDSPNPSRRPTAARWLTVSGLLTLALAAGPSTASADDGSLPDLSGTWAKKAVQTSITDLPVLGQTTSTTTSYVLVDIDQNGREITWRSRTCDARIDGDIGAVRTILPDAFVDAIPASRRSGRLVTTDDGRTRLKMKSDVIVMGADLRNPATEQLPDSAGARSVVDDDNDGKPGVTIRMKGLLNGRLYIVRRAKDTYTATVDGPDHFRGLVDWETDRRILKSTNPLLNSDQTTKPHPDAEKSWFEMARLDGDPTCNQLMSRTDDLFGN